jgi:signal transduction histidine kinase
MPPCQRMKLPARCHLFALLLAAWFFAFGATPVPGQHLTNLLQLTQSLTTTSQTNRSVDLTVTVCAASRPDVGVLIVQDETGVELLQLGNFQRLIQPGEQIRIRHNDCLVRKRDMGVELSAMPVVFNDGLHPWTSRSGTVSLKAGKHPLKVEWFNYWRTLGLEVQEATATEASQYLNPSNLWHAVITDTGATNFLPGLRAECYEGSWKTVPDFNLLRPVKTEVVTNIDLSIRPRNEAVGIRYSGYLEVPQDGEYQFMVGSDDGALLFIGDPRVQISRLGRTSPPAARPTKLLTAGFKDPDERRWTTVEGRITFISPNGEGVRFDLGSDRHIISVHIADAAGLDISRLLYSRVRITGVGRGAVTLDQTPVIGKLFAASAADLVFVEPALGELEPDLPITSVARVQNLPIDRARQALPVRIRGTVTGGVSTSQERWMSFQDDTRGIFVRLNAISNAVLAVGELWEVEGHSGAGDFAPVVVADKITRLGEGLLPAPVVPTWTELLNGSRDVQWAELKGLVTEVQSNSITLHLPEGRLRVQMDGLFESELKPYLKDVVRIRGVLYAVWDATTREVRVGQVMMRNTAISREVPAPADPFDAVGRTPRELLLFDAQASAFRPVKVRGQIVYADATQLYLEEDGTGLRLLPTEQPTVRPGDLVEAVGYPDIGRSQLVLREVLLRKTGHATLAPAPKTDEAGLTHENLNSRRVRMEGRLLGWHMEEGAPVLEMQSGSRLYLARVAPGKSTPFFGRPGSRLALDGVYVGRGQSHGGKDENESFELLLNSLADVALLSQPSWWTLPRLLALVGVLVVILVFTMIWNTQLRRLVEQRTTQLQRETRERERVEHQHALEAERSRIARDLHDDLGSSLTEISVLASTGQLRQHLAVPQPGLFQAIGDKARSLISSLDGIVWAVDPEDNSLQSLADYLSGYTDEFFSHTSVACRFKVPVSFPAVTIEGRVRHDLLMAVKETLNNIVRHADATEVEFRMTLAGHQLEIEIADNGKGITATGLNSGHGLKNLATRLEQLGGAAQVTPRPGGGTTVKILLPLAIAAPGVPSQTGRG